MERFFNTAGPQTPDAYTIDPLTRFDLDDVLMLIRQQRYFVLHAPRQTGKTSCMLALRDLLDREGQYIAVYANVEGGQASRTDLLIRKPLTDGYGGPVQRIVLELKIRRGSLDKVIADGLEQTVGYMDLVGSVDEGHLIIFDRTQEKTWDERLWHRTCQHRGRAVMVWGM